MNSRRLLLGVLVAAPLLPFGPQASAGTFDTDAPARRTLQNLEAAWVKLRFQVDQAFEQALVPRESWVPAKPMTVRGTFDIGDRETGQAEQIVDGVRSGLPVHRPTGSSR